MLASGKLSICYVVYLVDPVELRCFDKCMFQHGQTFRGGKNVGQQSRRQGNCFSNDVQATVGVVGRMNDAWTGMSDLGARGLVDKDDFGRLLEPRN